MAMPSFSCGQSHQAIASSASATRVGEALAQHPAGVADDDGEWRARPW